MASDALLARRLWVSHGSLTKPDVFGRAGPSPSQPLNVLSAMIWDIYIPLRRPIGRFILGLCVVEALQPKPKPGADSGGAMHRQSGDWWRGFPIGS